MHTALTVTLQVFITKHQNTKHTIPQLCKPVDDSHTRYIFIQLNAQTETIRIINNLPTVQYYPGQGYKFYKSNLST